MAIKTSISYCDSTVSPTPTCSGCELFHKDLSKNHCFAHRMSRRWGSGANKGWPESFTKYQFFPGRIEKACGWSDLTGTKRPDKPHLDGMPRVIFLNDMGDGFSPIAPLDWAEPYIDMMADSPHIWLWLTKWPHRMVEFFSGRGSVPENFWLGTTITRQETLWRVEQLVKLRSMAKVLWVSAEPLLEEVVFQGGNTPALPGGDWPNEPYWSHSYLRACPGAPRWIDWLAAGGLSGQNAFPTHPDAFRSLRDQSQVAGVKFYFKQHGEWQGVDQSTDDLVPGTSEYIFPDGTICHQIGTKQAGHLLDGREWTEMPG